MKVAGVIAEYNPFHSGHLLHITRTREKADVVVAVMSGAFTQRGTPGVISKWARAEMAAKCGVDLVLELPYPFSCAPAEIFAFGGADLLNKLGIIDYLSFGSESGDIDKIRNTAEILENNGKEISAEIKNSRGKSYAAAVAEAVNSSFSDSALDSPNDLLGVKYIMALNKIKSAIKPLVIKREGGYNSLNLDGDYASAAAIRNVIDLDINSASRFMPKDSFSVLTREISSGKMYDFSKLDSYFTGILRRDKNFANIAYVAEGVENRFIKAAEKFTTIKEILDYVKTKRYTYSRLSRIAAAIMTGLDKEALSNNLHSGVLYARVLAIGENGGEIIKKIKNNADIPIISRGGEYQSYDAALQNQFQLEMRAGNIAALCQNMPGPANSDLLNVPFILNP